jgi:multiple RNA-binding domain-containing protein 1
MSRLIVKGLPKRYDERLLRELFSCGGDVTDAKVMRTTDGRSRQFGFVGFRTKMDAQQACHCLNRTYVDAAQISVETARAVGDAEIPRPWSKYSKGSSRHDGNGSPSELNTGPAPNGASDETCVHAEKEGERREKLANDPAFREFKQAVAKRSKNPLWTDGAGRAQPIVTKSMVASKKTGGEGLLLERSHVVFDDVEDASDEDDDNLYEELDVSKGAGRREHDERPAKSKTNSDAYVPEEQQTQEQTTARDENVDDLAYFRSKVSKMVDSKDAEGRGTIASFEDSEEEETEHESDDDDSDAERNGNGTDSGDKAHVPSREQAKFSHENESLSAAANSGHPSGPCSNELFRGEEKADASETGRLFLRNLAYSVTEDDLESLFEPFGAIADIHIVQDPHTKLSRGVAFVLFVVPDNAVKAMAALDRTVLNGRLLHILPGKARPIPHNGGIGIREGPVGVNSFKMDRELARKESAKSGADSVAYNAMYMSTDAVAEVMADRYGLSKTEIYGTGRGDSGAAAVRLAAGEAKLQAENREYLLCNGIDMQVAQEASRDVRRKKLSRTAFMVKNLPARTTEEQLDGMFSAFGLLDRVLVVPAGLLAIVVFVTANDAKRAYTSLAYTRLKGTPLYLEWLPSAAVVGLANRSQSDAAAPRREIKAVPLVSDRENPGEGREDAGAAEEGIADSLPRLSVFVKNLNFDTRDDALRKHFQKVLRKHPTLAQGVRAATVSTRPNPKDPSGPRLSYGFGFVEFGSERDAMEAVKLAQGTALDGHTLELRIANRKAGSEKSGKRKSTSTAKRAPSAKLLVRNIAFEATARDIRHLFGTFGQLKSVRVPKRQDGSHRGFGFVEFVSKIEASLAFNSLSAAHLYGRHLVIEFAAETADGYGSLEELQAKAALQVSKRRRIENAGQHGESADTAAVDDDHQQMMDEMFA